MFQARANRSIGYLKDYPYLENDQRRGPKIEFWISIIPDLTPETIYKNISQHRKFNWLNQIHEYFELIKYLLSFKLTL